MIQFIMRIYLFIISMILCFSAFAKLDIVSKNKTTISLEQHDVKELLDELSNINHRIASLENTIKDLSSHLIEMERKLFTDQDFIKNHSQNTEKNYEKEKKDYDLALYSLKLGEDEVAVNKFLQFIDYYKNSTLLSNVYFWLGEIFYKKREFEKSSLYFSEGYIKFPHGIKASDSLLKLAISSSEINKAKDACKAIEILQREFKDRPLNSIQKEKEILEKYNCKR
jgi:TolA-binding protein